VASWRRRGQRTEPVVSAGKPPEPEGVGHGAEGVAQGHGLRGEPAVAAHLTGHDDAYGGGGRGQENHGHRRGRCSTPRMVSRISPTAA